MAIQLKRFFAYTIDCLLIMAIIYITNWGLKTLDFTTDYNYIIGLIEMVLYGTILEASSKQATFGKMAVGIAVCDQEGEPLSFVQSLIRNIIKTVNIVFLYWLGYVLMFITSNQQALQDFVAKTFVVEEEDLEELYEEEEE